MAPACVVTAREPPNDADADPTDHPFDSATDASLSCATDGHVGADSAQSLARPASSTARSSRGHLRVRDACRYGPTVLTGIDHVIIASADPDADAARLEATLGLRAAGGGRHEAHGTRNRLLWLGDSYIELMGVFDPSRAEQSWWGAHVLEGARAGGRYAGIALESDAIDADVTRLRALGSPISEPLPGERLRPDGGVVRWSIGRLPGPDAELGLTFAIAHDRAAAEWTDVDRVARGDEVHPIGTPAELARVELPVADVVRASMLLLRGLGLQFRPSLAGGGARDTSIGRHVLRLAKAREGLSPTVVIRAGRVPRRVQLLGCDWAIVPLER